MNTLEVIEQLRDELNKNSINDNIAFDELRLTTAFNRAQNKFVEWIIQNKSNEDVRLIQKLVTNNYTLKKSNKSAEDSEFFELPNNFFDHINITVKAAQKECEATMFVWEVKGQNVHELLQDESNKPSFYYRETFYTIGEDNIRLYTNKDFNITKASLDYYRYPKQISLEGFIDINNNVTSTVNPEWDDKEISRIVSIAVKDLNINTENLNRFQADNSKIIQKF